MGKGKPKTPDTNNTLPVHSMKGESQAATIVRTVTRPTVQAAITAQGIIGEFAGETVNLGEFISTLHDQVNVTKDGDLSRTEAMLVTQSQTLDLLFNRLTRQAMMNVGQYSETAERYMKLALRAQSQCRANAETLHEMKHPRPVYFGQANIANGPQQVNNGGKAEFPHQYAHGRAGDTHLATVAAVNRAKFQGR